MSELLVAYAPTVTAVAGALAGYIAGRRKAPRPPAPPKPPKAICGCTHALAMHDPETNRCHAVDRREGYNKKGDWAEIAEPCTCRQYTGPRPIDQVFQPRILPPE